MKGNCVYCGKELEFDGFYAPSMCNECNSKWLKNIRGEFNLNPVMQEKPQQGWVCPKCGAVMSPYERSCINCYGNQRNQFTCDINTTGTKYVNPNPNQTISLEGENDNV